MATRTTHTPGPWAYSEERGTITSNRIGVVAKMTADTCSEAWGEEARANARLIAAAPEMLNALQTIAGNHYESAQYARDVARALLARIEGR